MPTHKHPLSYYKTMGLLLGGRYDRHDHTIMIPKNGEGFYYDRYIDPDTAETVDVIDDGGDDDITVWDLRKRVYQWWVYPPEE